jgi:ankyrin repeat protein
LIGELFLNRPRDQTPGAPTDSVNQGGWTALHWSCYQGQLGPGAALLAAGADCNAVDDAGKS